MSPARLILHKTTHWEYWPFNVLYIPIIFVWSYYALKARTLFFFNTVNPSIINGGFFMESKKEIYDLIPKHYYPETIFIQKKTPVEDIGNKIAESNITYPFIAKPDTGMRGSGVKKINSEEELKNYADKAGFNFLIQQLVSYKNEAGIFFVRMPDTEDGIITGIVAKEFLAVTGDGVSTIRKLLKKDPRHAMQIKPLEQIHGQKLEEVLPTGETFTLVPFGNHCRGAKFTDASHKITPQLTDALNKICSDIEGFYFGRIDIMFDSFENLERGEDFSIIEINGAGSEPTHIYDPKHSVFFAWKEIIRHIGLMYKIGHINYKSGLPYLNHKEGMHQFKLHKEQNRKIAEV